MRTIENDITTILLNGKEYSAIIIGPEGCSVPKHILQTERQNGIIISPDKQISSFEWKGITKDQKYQYVYFEKTQLEPLETITTNHRSDSLKLLRLAAFGLMNASEQFLNMATGIFPLDRIYIINNDSILLLPPDMGDLLAIAKMGERREKEANYLNKRDVEKGFTLISEFAQLMYWAAAGRLPYENKNVRICGYTEVPLNWYEDELDEKCQGFISFVLHAKERQMREISGNRKNYQNLSWFLSRTEELDWNLESIDIEKREERIEKTEKTNEFSHYFEKVSKDAKRREFWRVKGTIIVSISIVAIVILSIVGAILKGNFEPPHTKDMNQVEIVEDFFLNMNNLDPARLDNNAFKVDIPQYNTVVGLYVNMQTRSAYEMKIVANNLTKWLENGKPAIEETSYIYGADIESINQIDENKLRASGTWYLPFRENEELDIQPPDGYTAVYKYAVDEDFTFEKSRRGWWIVTGIDIPKYEYIGYELVPTYKTQTPIEKLTNSK